MKFNFFILIILVYLSQQDQVENKGYSRAQTIFSGWLRFFYYVANDNSMNDCPLDFEINPEYELNNINYNKSNFQEDQVQKNQALKTISFAQVKENSIPNQNNIKDNQIKQPFHDQFDNQSELIDYKNKKQSSIIQEQDQYQTQQTLQSNQFLHVDQQNNIDTFLTSNNHQELINMNNQPVRNSLDKIYQQNEIQTDSYPQQQISINQDQQQYQSNIPKLNFSNQFKQSQNVSSDLQSLSNLFLHQTSFLELQNKISPPQYFIPTKNSFFFSLTSESLIISTIQNSLSHVYKSINIGWISILNDLGDFKEGHCLKIKTIQQAVYTLCADDHYQKQNWIKYIQREVTLYQNQLKNQEKQIEINLENKQIEVKRLSDRFQRFEMCEIREGDLNIGLNQISPCRVILNKETISIFNSAYSFSSVYLTFDLKYVKVGYTNIDREDCFQIQDTRDSLKKAELCIMPGTDLKDQTIQNFRDKWIKDVENFRDECTKPQAIVQNVIQDIEIERFKKEINQQQSLIKMDAMMQQKMKNREVEENVSVEKAISKQSELVEKELQFERMALEEEQLRERKEEQAMKAQIEKEKEKQIQRMLILKQKKEDYTSFEDSKEQIKVIEDNTKKELIQARSQVYQKIMEMRKAADRRKLVFDLYRNKEDRLILQEVVLPKLFLVRKRKETLRIVKFPLVKRKGINIVKPKYQMIRFPLSLNVLACLKQLFKQNFCLACCDNEFGLNYFLERKSCYKKKCQAQENDETNQNRVLQELKLNYKIGVGSAKNQLEQ